MSGVLARYIARKLTLAFIAIMATIIVLAVIGNLVELLRKGGGQDGPGVFALMMMATLQAPSISIKATPFVMLLAATWTFIRLSGSSEMVAARAAGFSFWRIAGPAMAASAMLGALIALAFNPLAAKTLEQYQRLDARWFDGRASLLSVSAEGLWLREGLGETQTVIHALGANGEGTELRDVTFFEFTADDRFLARTDAERAMLTDGAWLLSGVVRRTLDPEADAATGEVRLETAEAPTRLTAQRIQESFAPPETISVWEAPAFIAEMERSGFSARRHKTHFHATLTLPVLFSAMTLIAGALSIRPPRFARFGWIALGCALTGFAFYFLSDVAMALAGSGAAPPMLGAWAPPFAASLVGLALALRFEEGTT